MHLVAVRHGETQHNVDRITQGQFQTQLTAKGIEQAKELGHLLADQHFDLIVSSDLERCTQTLEYIKIYHVGTPVEVTPSLREYNYGIFQNKPVSSWSWHGQPGSSDLLRKPPEGESGLEVMTRLAEVTNDVFARLGDNSSVLFVSHGGPIRLFRVLLEGVDFDDRFKDKIANCSIWEFEVKQPIRVNPLQIEIPAP